MCNKIFFNIIIQCMVILFLQPLYCYLNNYFKFRFIIYRTANKFITANVIFNDAENVLSVGLSQMKLRVIENISA